MKMLLGLFLVLFSEAFAANDGEKVLAGFDAKTDLIADNYEAGRFLLYDCEEGHWVCVTEPFFQECEQKRAHDITTKKVKARCAPLGSFPTKKSCFQRELFLTSQAHGAKFCILKDWKEKELRFDFQVTRPRALDP